MEIEDVPIDGEELLKAGSRDENQRAPNLSPKIKPIDRRQAVWTPLDVENLVPPEHKVRAIWDLTGRMDLSALRQQIKNGKTEARVIVTPPALSIFKIPFFLQLLTKGAVSAPKLRNPQVG